MKEKENRDICSNCGIFVDISESCFKCDRPFCEKCFRTVMYQIEMKHGSGGRVLYFWLCDKCGKDIYEKGLIDFETVKGRINLAGFLYAGAQISRSANYLSDRKEKGVKPKSLTPCCFWLPGPDSNQRQGG